MLNDTPLQFCSFLSKDQFRDTLFGEMAKLSSCYPLCPLIDRSPIGVTSDSVPGCAIVTLGKNIVIRYKLADQKQASSWSSKDKLSAPVIYDDAGKRYIAVFNQSIVRLWNDTEVDLNKEKKLKFDHSIHSILNHSSLTEPVVIFKNGAAISISIALSDRKKLWSGPLSPNVTIKECFYINFDNTDCVAIIAMNNKDQNMINIVEVGGKNRSLLSVSLERSGKNILGHTVMQTDQMARLFTLWSDGQLFSLPLKSNTSSEDGVGCSLYTVKAVSTKHVVAMTQMSNNHLAIYGADPSDEGAVLAVINTQFMLVQARQHYKLFSNCTNLWIIGNNLLLVVGHSLAVVPFLLDTERLCALIGSHKPLQSSKSKANEVEQVLVMENAIWNEEEGKEKPNGDVLCLENDKSSPEIIKKFISQGYSQAMLCEKLIPSLLEDLNIPVLMWLLKNSRDFPESALVPILIFCLDAPVNAFNEVNFGLENGTDNESMDIDGEDSSDSQNALVELSSAQRSLLDIIIRTPCSEAIILSYLRSKLTLPHCLVLLQFIAQSLPQIKSVPHAQALLRWAGILLDSHYQQLLLSKDECVASTVTALKELVELQIEYMDDLKTIRAIFDTIGKSPPTSSTITNNFYSIETVRLY